MNTCWTVCAVLLIITLKSGFALKCYVCHSGQDKFCKEITDESKNHIVECPEVSEISECRKILQKVPNEDWRTIRYCGYIPSTKDSMRTVGSTGVSKYLYSCDQDLCNDASKNAFSLTLGLVVSFVILQ